MKRTRPDPPLPQWLTLLAWGSVGMALVVLFGVWPVGGGDLRTHLTIGRWTWQHGTTPLSDVFSYMTAGEEFIALGWLAGLVFYLIDQAAGTLGFMVLRFALLVVALLGAVRVAPSNAFSKKWENLKAALATYFVYYNFMRTHQSLRITPAMESRLTDHVWSWEELLEYAV